MNTHDDNMLNMFRVVARYALENYLDFNGGWHLFVNGYSIELFRRDMIDAGITDSVNAVLFYKETLSNRVLEADRARQRIAYKQCWYDSESNFDG